MSWNHDPSRSTCQPKARSQTHTTPPFFPTRLPPPPPPSVQPPRLIVDIPDTEASPPPRSAAKNKNREKAKLEERPVTPLDFFGASASASTPTPTPKKPPVAMVSEQQKDLLDQGQPQHPRIRTSVDQDRPSVDPTIRGIPQGWDDDPTVPVPPAQPTSIKPTPTTRTLAAPSHPFASSSPTPRTASVSQPIMSPAAAKLGPFRETRTKLSSFSGRMKENLREREKDREVLKSGGGGVKLHKGSVRVGQRSSTLNPGILSRQSRPTATSPPTQAGPASSQARAQTQTHAPTHSVYSESSFNTHTTAETTGSGSGSIPAIAPSRPAVPCSTDEGTEPSTTEEFSQLFTPSPTTQYEPDYPASISSSMSVSSRERVLGIKNDPTPTPQAGMKTFAKPNIAEVLPFAAGHPFAAWSTPVAEEDFPSQTTGTSGSARRGSLSHHANEFGGKDGQKHSLDSLEGWKEAPRSRTGLPGKKVWVDAKGQEISSAYRVGWERDVMDLEARLHETMYDLAGERHVFAEFTERPTAVLDIGTGAGFWPISMALQWPTARFVGLDIVPCQIDLSVLADAERRARSTSDGKGAHGLGKWESIAKRITWQRGNFLTELPFDTGVFDLVHLRFLNLGIPESKWFDLLEEATRVLRPGGTLEIVETSYTLPETAPLSLRNSFASLLLADMIQPHPLLPMQFNLPSVSALKGGGSKPVFQRKFSHTPTGFESGSRASEQGALEDAVMVWVKSALDYKGTGIVKNTSSATSRAGAGGAARRGVNGVGERMKRELTWAGKGRWSFDEYSVLQKEAGDVGKGAGGDHPKHGTEEATKGETTVWVWVATKK